jgi:hypothetical protein
MAGLASHTYDPTVPADFQLGIAASGRGGCRNPACEMSNAQSKKIAKGALRIARMEPSPTEKLGGRVVPKWVHLECCAPVILQEAVDRYNGIEHVPGFDSLEIEQQTQVAEIAMTILNIGKKKKKESVNEKENMEKKQRSKSKS